MHTIHRPILLASIITVGAAALIVIPGIHTRREQTYPNNTIAVTASFYPLAHFAEQVAGDLGTVHTIVPSGVEPHDFEPTPQDIARIQQAKIFLYNGAGLDHWAEDAARNVQSGTDILNMSAVVPSRNDDPHFWLDPLIAKKEVAVIRQALIAADPSHADQYTERAHLYDVALDTLDTDYRVGLEQCAVRKIIVSHDAFEYLADRYNIETITIAGISPENEPSPQQVADIIRIARENSISTIFFETLVSSKLSETVAAEIGGTTDVLNPIEGLAAEEIANGNNYLSVMRDNLQHLRAAMRCE